MKMTNKKAPQDYSRPVAYDVDGRPLYAHPPTNDDANPIQVVHVARVAEPQKVEVSDSVKKRHDRSEKRYPELSLSEGEFVVSAVKRHPIGLFMPIALGALLILLSLFELFNNGVLVDSMEPIFGSAAALFVSVAILVFIGLVAIGVYIACFVYRNNKFFLTNESVIQHVQTGLFYRHEQIVSLVNIEDVSYFQKGILQQIFNYGTIRLSTEGEETTYVFAYVENPRGYIALLNNAVEAFKNGRPVVND